MIIPELFYLTPCHQQGSLRVLICRETIASLHPSFDKSVNLLSNDFLKFHSMNLAASEDFLIPQSFYQANFQLKHLTIHSQYQTFHSERQPFPLTQQVNAFPQ